MICSKKTAEKGLETIEKFVKENKDKINNNDCLDEIERIPYNTDREFIEDLRKYIREEASECREKLLRCDFVTVRDHILKFKKKGPARSRKIKKLSGGPIEVLLRAVWLTLGEFVAMLLISVNLLMKPAEKIERANPINMITKLRLKRG